MKIRTQLTVFFLLITIIPIIFIGFWSFFQAKTALQQPQLAKLEIVADLKADKIETFFHERRGDITAVCDYFNIRRNLPIVVKYAQDRNHPEYLRAKSELDSQLKTFQRIYGYLDLMLTDQAGKIVYVSDESHAIELDSTLSGPGGLAFEEGKKGLYLTDVFTNKIRHEGFEMIISAPLHDLNGEFIGVIAFEIDMEPIYAFVQDTTGLGETGETLLGKKMGNYALFLNPLRHDKNAALKRKVKFGDLGAIPIQKAAQGKSGSGISIDYRGREIIAAWRYLPSLDCGLVTKIDTAEAFAPVKHLRNQVFLLELVVLALAVLIANFIAKSISGPIKALHKGVEIIGRGNLDYKTGIDAKNEVGALSRSFDQMTTNLKAVTASRDELDREIAERKQVEKELKWELTVNEALSKLYKPLISPASSIENIANTVLDQARSLTNSRYGYVSSIIPQTGDSVVHTLTEMLKDQCRVSPHEKKIVFPRGLDGLYSGLWGHSLNTRKAFFTNSPETHQASKGLPDGHIPIQRFLSVPVLLGDELVGQISLANKKKEDYTQRDLDAISRLAEFYALGIQRRRAHDALQKVRDELEQRVQERTSELSKNVKALQRSEARLAEAQRMAHLGNWDWDIVKNNLWWSDEIYCIFGLNPQEFAATYEAFLPYVHPDDREFVKESVNQALYEHKPYSIDHRVVHPDGTERIVHECARVVYDAEGNPTRMMGTVQDITERKQAEEDLLKYQKQLQLMASELTLAEERQRRSIAEELHDQVGQLLTAANMKLEYLEGSACPGDLSQAISPARELIQQAIQYTRSLTFELSPPRLYTLGFESAIKWLAEQMDEQYNIRCDFKDDEMPKPMADEVNILLYRIVRELLHNVAKHAAARRAKVSLSKVGNNIQICVEDDGIGFDHSEIKSDPGRGGFGLFSVRERLNYLKGNMEIQSGPGRGTQTIVTVPLNPVVE
jgi:PAS domain S-box-containing protein